MREYRQLTDEDRIEIYAMKQAGKDQNKIAVALGVAPSTVSRELARNRGLRGYRPKQAQQKALLRRLTARKAVKMMPETVDYIECKLAKDHSPEQIAGRLRHEYPDDMRKHLSAETIYVGLYVLPRGTLRSKLLAALRQARKARRPRAPEEEIDVARSQT